jgi:uridine kinase
VKGDIIIVEEHHRRAARKIADRIISEIQAKEGRYTITIGGESGSGKSELAKAIAEVLEEKGVRCGIYQQDDYFVYPPKTNDAARRKDIKWVGPQEVRLDLLDEHLKAALDGKAKIRKPLVVYDQDKITEETMCLEGLKVVIAEGTYTTLLSNVVKKIFITRDHLETMETRRKRGREAMEPFIERVLAIEHGIISAHKEKADIVITRDYDIEF